MYLFSLRLCHTVHNEHSLGMKDIQLYVLYILKWVSAGFTV